MLNGNRMKSNRGRSPRDFYTTPPELVESAIWAFRYDEDLQYPLDGLDAGCGNGVWGIEAFGGLTFAYDEENDYPDIDAIDLEVKIPSYRTHLFDHIYTDDFITHDFGNKKYDIVFGNPPYSLAEEFIRRSLDLVNEDGYVYFLLRLSFLEGINRGNKLFREFPPKRIYVCSRRPSFFHGGKTHTTDTLAYAMFLWQKGYEGNPELDWLDWKYNA